MNAASITENAYMLCPRKSDNVLMNTISYTNAANPVRKSIIPYLSNLYFIMISSSEYLERRDTIFVYKKDIPPGVVFKHSLKTIINQFVINFQIGGFIY